MAIGVRKKLADSIIEEFKRMLEDGIYKEGDKLPNQFEFAEEMGVSRQSLREAMQTLQAMGVITQKPKVGTVVVLGDPNKWIKEINTPLLSDFKATMELIEARKLLEPAITAIVADKISPDEIKKLQQIISKMKDSFKTGNEKEYLKLDVEFHFEIANITKNRYLINMYITIINKMEQFVIEVYQSMPLISSDSVSAHIKITESLKTGNKKMAVQNAEEHISNIEKTLEQYYSNR